MCPSFVGGKKYVSEHSSFELSRRILIAIMNPMHLRNIAEEDKHL